LDKIYQIKCPPDSVQELQDAATFLDKKMREIRDGGKVVGLDRVAVVAALNIAYDFLSIEQKENAKVETMATRIRDMQRRIEELFTQADQGELL
jgi:cell division protein ZapA